MSEKDIQEDSAAVYEEFFVPAIFRQWPAESLPFDVGSFDAVVSHSRFAIHKGYRKAADYVRAVRQWLSAAFRIEIRTVLKQTGRRKMSQRVVLQRRMYCKQKKCSKGLCRCFLAFSASAI